MSIETPAKRQRTSDAAKKSPKKSSRSPLSGEQLRTIRHAQYIDNGIVASEQLRNLRAGSSDLGQIGLVISKCHRKPRPTHKAQPRHQPQRHVIVQHPSTTPGSAPCDLRTYTRAVIICIRSDCWTISTTSWCHRASSTTTTRYDDPRQISFSPCGYYLCAYFPH